MNVFLGELGEEGCWMTLAHAWAGEGLSRWWGSKTDPPGYLTEKRYGGRFEESRIDMSTGSVVMGGASSAAGPMKGPMKISWAGLY